MISASAFHTIAAASPTSRCELHTTVQAGMPLLLAGAMTTVSAAGGALSQTAQLAHPASCIAALLLRSLPQQAILQRKAGLLAGQLPAAGAAAVHAASSAQEQQLPNGWPWLCEQHASHYDGGDEAVVHDRLQDR